MAFNLSRSNLTQLVPVAGARTPTDLRNATKTHWLTVTVRGHLSVTVAGAGVRNRGSLLAAFTEMGILENGNPTWLADPRVLRFVSECAAPSSLAAVRAQNANVQELDLVEQFRIYMAHPYSGAPWETAYLEHDTGLKLQFFARLDALGVSNIISGGTAALTNLQIDVQQGHDDADARLPLLRPTVRQILADVAGASSQLPIAIQTQHRLRAIVISQVADTVGEVNDIINAIAFRGDRKFVIGPEFVPFEDLAREQEQEYGGDVFSGPNGAHVQMNFQQFGRLANTLNIPAQDTNVRFLLDCQPTAAAGAGTSHVMITLFELEHDLQLGPGGRRVTDPNLPFSG